MATRSRASAAPAPTHADKKGKAPARGRGRGKGKDTPADEIIVGTFRTQEDLPRSHIRNAYNIDAICEKKKHTMNCKNNPNCFACLGETHLFSDDTLVPPALLGHDPRTMMRAEGAPGGLRNLGATCYMNSLLQCLFMNLPFREAVYNFKGNDDLCNELKNVFAHLQGSSQKYYDPRPLLNVTRASSGEQQDVQEYYKMLSTYLEELWRADSTLANFMPQSFYGECAYITTCKGCGRGSMNNSSFSELELAIKGSKSIEESMGKYIQKEVLDGENQYFCQGCNQKQDATRAMALLRLPPVLTVQLLRFVFDMQTLAKRKVRDGITFPHVLDMNPFMYHTPSESNTSKHTPDSAPSLHTSRSRAKKATTAPTASEATTLEQRGDANIYDLAAVVMHRGNAFGGHYIAHIRDHQGVWWQCDDEDVKRIDAVAVGVMDDTLGVTDTKMKKKKDDETKTTLEGGEVEGNVKATPKKRKKTGEKGKKGRSKKKKPDEAEADGTTKDEDVVIDDDTSSTSSTQGHMRSTTAYMLVYSRRQASSSSSSSSSSSTSTSTISTSVAMPPVPPAIDAKLAADNREFRTLVDRYNRLIEEYAATIRDRREEYNRIKEIINVPSAASKLGSASTTPPDPQPNVHNDEAQLIDVDNDQDNDEEYNWISTKWLRRWACGGGTQSAELLELTRAQREKDEARKKADEEEKKRAEEAQARAGTIPLKDDVLDNDVVLVDVPSTSTTSLPSSSSSSSVKPEASESSGNASTPDDARSMAIDNTELLCPHGQVNPRQLEHMKRISRAAWNVLHSTYGGGPTLDQSSLCAECVYSIVTNRQGMQQSSADKQRIIDLVAEGAETGYYICKAWYNEWKKRSPDLEKAGLDMVEGITCDHGKMSPYASGRKAIPVEAWSYLIELGFQAKREFLITDDTAQCEVGSLPNAEGLNSSYLIQECLQTEAVSKVEAAERKTRRADEKKSLLELYTKISDKSGYMALHHAIEVAMNPVDNDDDTPSSSAVRSGSWLYLVDRTWALNWRDYIDDLSIDDCPDRITNQSLVCEHNLAQYNVAFELERRLSPTPETSEPSPLPFFVTKEATWNSLLARYTGEPVRFRLEKEGLTYQPEVCTICMEQRTREDLVRKHNFTDGFVNIQITTPNSAKLGTTEVLPSTQPTLLDSTSRSGRGRYGLRRKNNGKKIEGLNAYMTLGDLKLKICEALGYSPIQQELSYHDSILSEKDKTLTELGIMSGVTLTMRLLDDEMDILDSDIPSSNQVETGFRNTIFQRNRNGNPIPKEELNTKEAPMLVDDSFEDKNVDRE